MYYLNSNSVVKIGDVVSTARHNSSAKYYVRDIDTDEGLVYLTFIVDKSAGQWVSGNALFLISN